MRWSWPGPDGGGGRQHGVGHALTVREAVVAGGGGLGGGEGRGAPHHGRVDPPGEGPGGPGVAGPGVVALGRGGLGVEEDLGQEPGHAA